MGEWAPFRYRNPQNAPLFIQITKTAPNHRKSPYSLTKSQKHCTRITGPLRTTQCAEEGQHAENDAHLNNFLPLGYFTLRTSTSSTDSHNAPLFLSLALDEEKGLLDETKRCSTTPPPRSTAKGRRKTLLYSVFGLLLLPLGK